MTQPETQDGVNIGLEYVKGLNKEASIETEDPQPIYILPRDTIKAFLHETAALLTVPGRLLGLLGVEVTLVASLLTATFRDFFWIKGDTLKGFFIAAAVLVAALVAADLVRIVKNWGAYSVDALTKNLGSRGSRIGRQSQEEKRGSVATDGAGRVQLADSLRVMRWDGQRWRVKPLEDMTVRKLEGCLKITNSTGIHSFAYIILNNELTDSFRIQLELQGDYENVRITASNGEDRNIYAVPSAEQLDKSERHTVVVTRQRDKVAFRTEQEVDLPTGLYHGSAEMPCFVAVSLASRKSVKIFSWDLVE